MTFVSEQRIDEAIDLLNSEEQSEAGIKALKKEKPVLLAYLFSDHFKVFSSEEQAFMLYMTTVIWQSVKACFAQLPIVTVEDLGGAEEHNWELLQSVSARNFKERLDIFFKNYEQEDLLAFVEDAITDDDESVVSMEGREAIFIAMKSIIDCLTKKNQL